MRKKKILVFLLAMILTVSMFISTGSALGEDFNDLSWSTSGYGTVNWGSGDQSIARLSIDKPDGDKVYVFCIDLAHNAATGGDYTSVALSSLISNSAKAGRVRAIINSVNTGNKDSFAAGQAAIWATIDGISNAPVFSKNDTARQALYATYIALTPVSSIDSGDVSITVPADDTIGPEIPINYDFSVIVENAIEDPKVTASEGSVAFKSKSGDTYYYTLTVSSQPLNDITVNVSANGTVDTVVGLEPNNSSQQKLAGIYDETYTESKSFVLEIERYLAVTFSTTAGGKIDGQTDDIVHSGMTDGNDVPTPPSTSANSNYHFLGWTKDGGSTYYTTSQVDAMTVTADVTFTAEYEEDSEFRVHNSNGPGGDHGYMKVAYNGEEVNLDAGETHTFIYISTAGDIRVDFIPDTNWAFDYFVIQDPAAHTTDNPAYFDPSVYEGQPGANNQLSLNPKWATSQTYTVTWNNWNGTQLEQDLNVPFGATPTYNGAVPTRPSTAEFNYTFAGWTPEIAPVTGDATYVATFTPETRSYTVTWNNWNSAQLEQDLNVPFGATPTYNGAVPTRPSTAEFNYTFAGWTPEIAPVTGDATYVATFTPETRSYTVTWNNWNSAQLEQDLNVPFGATPTYNGAVPTRPSTAEFNYTFAGWTPEIAPVTGDATYVATFTPETRSYTVTWNNWNSTQLEQDLNVLYGATPTYNGAVPTRPSTAEFNYTFAGWTPEIAPVTGDATYVATFTPETRSYTVTWNNWNSTQLEQDLNVLYGATPTYNGAVPTRPSTAEFNYTFAGWTPEIVSVTGDATYVATFTPDAIEYNISYTLAGGLVSIPNPLTYTAETETFTLNNPTKAGYNFTGWTGTGLTAPTMTVTIPIGSTGDRSYTATWSDPIEYDITYIMNGGTNDPANPATYTVESPLITLADPAKAGYNFTGWTPTDNIPAGSTGDKVFTAAWSDPIEYTITYVMNGGTNAPANPATYTVESPLITLADPAKAGYDFAGWAPTDNIPAGSTGNKTFTATWSDPIEYTITYVMNGGTNAPANPATYTIESPLITLADPAKAGYDFAGWTPTDNIPAGSMGNKTFTATWSDPIVYTITYVMNGGTNNPANPATYTVESPLITLAAPARANYGFTGWTATNTIPAGSTGDRTFTAGWALNTYTVTFIDFDEAVLGTDTVGYGGDATAPEEPERAGYTFTGWDTDFTNVTSDLTVQALYEQITFTVTFVDFDGTVLGTQTVPYGGDATAPAEPEREGYGFTGWDTDFTNVTSDLTVTALYQINVYTVTFVDHDGTVIEEQQVEWGNDATAPADPAWDEHTFTGWDTEFTNVTSDLTVTAQYTETIPEEEEPEAGPDNNWLWWLLLIPGIGLIILLLAFWLKIVPIVEKMTKNADGTYTIQWGYENRKGRKVELDEEDDSKLSALAGSIISSTLVSPTDGDTTVPPVKFEKGRVENVFVTIATADAKVEWKIRNRKATADLKKEENK